MLKSVKEENDRFSPKEEMILECNSRTCSPAIAHGGEKNYILRTKEMPFSPNSPLAGLSRHAGSKLATFRLSPGLPSEGFPALCRGQGAGLQGG